MRAGDKDCLRAHLASAKPPPERQSWTPGLSPVPGTSAEGRHGDTSGLGKEKVATGQHTPPRSPWTPARVTEQAQLEGSMTLGTNSRKGLQRSDSWEDPAL